MVTAESIDREDNAWVAFRVDYEPPAQAAAEEPPGEEEISSPESGPDTEADARELDQRLNGWRYNIARYQFDQMTRRMSDLLRSLPDES